MGDDIDSMLNEEEKQIELEEFKEELERRAKKKTTTSSSRTFGLADDEGMIAEFVPAELEPIDHHLDSEKRMIEEKLTLPPKVSSSKTTTANKKKIPGASPARPQSGAGRSKLKGMNSTKKQKERYSKE